MKKTTRSSFKEFLKTRPRKSRVCSTCRNPTWKSLTERWALLDGAGIRVPMRIQLHEYLVKEHGYSLSYEALNLHLRRCLGSRHGR